MGESFLDDAGDPVIYLQHSRGWQLKLPSWPIWLYNFRDFGVPLQKVLPLLALFLFLEVVAENHHIGRPSKFKSAQLAPLLHIIAFLYLRMHA